MREPGGRCRLRTCSDRFPSIPVEDLMHLEHRLSDLSANPGRSLRLFSELLRWSTGIWCNGCVNPDIQPTSYERNLEEETE